MSAAVKKWRKLKKSYRKYRSRRKGYGERSGEASAESVNEMAYEEYQAMAMAKKAKYHQKIVMAGGINEGGGGSASGKRKAWRKAESK